MGGRRGNRWCLCIEGALKEVPIEEELREPTKGNAKAVQLEQALYTFMCASVVGIWK